MEREAGRTVHREQLIDKDGMAVTDRHVEVQYVVGSGGRGRSYLTEKNGFVFMSPLTWYPEKSRCGSCLRVTR